MFWSVIAVAAVNIGFLFLPSHLRNVKLSVAVSVLMAILMSLF